MVEQDTHNVEDVRSVLAGTTMEAHAYFDGSCKDNPGGAIGYGCTVTHFHEDDTPIEYMDWAGRFSHKNNSNNTAEYKGLLLIFEYLISNNITNKEVVIHGDSALVINQISGKWKPKKGLYIEDARKAILQKYTIENEQNIKFTFKWIPREQNTLADALSNRFHEEPR